MGAVGFLTINLIESPIAPPPDRVRRGRCVDNCHFSLLRCYWLTAVKSKVLIPQTDATNGFCDDTLDDAAGTPPRRSPARRFSARPKINLPRNLPNPLLFIARVHLITSGVRTQESELRSLSRGIEGPGKQERTDDDGGSEAQANRTCSSIGEFSSPSRSLIRQ